MVRTLVFPGLARGANQPDPFQPIQSPIQGDEGVLLGGARQVSVEHPHVLECPAEQNWKSWRSCILFTAEAVLGQRKKRQPDWFIQAADMLQPLLQAKQHAHDVTHKQHCKQERV